MRVLIADDDGVIRRVFAQILQRFGYEVVLAFDGNQAWELLQKPNAPHLLILDWLMPGMDGPDLCRRLREMEHEISPFIILLTGMSNKKELAKGFEAGADDCVTKSLNPDELLAIVRVGERVINLELELQALKQSLQQQAAMPSENEIVLD